MILNEITPLFRSAPARGPYPWISSEEPITPKIMFIFSSSKRDSSFHRNRENACGSMEIEHSDQQPYR